MNAARAADLLAANEQLVLAVIQAQDEAAAAAQALKEATRCAHLAEIAERPDGALLFNRLTQGMAAARRSGSRLGLLFLSIDNFRNVTDAQGHAVGEQVLTIAGKRVVTAVRSSDTVSRHGASDFLILLTSVSAAADAIAVAESAIAALALPMPGAGATVRLLASVGISVFPDDGDDPDALIDRATAAMYRARRGGLGSFFYCGESPTSARSLELRSAEASRGTAAARDAPQASPDPLGAHQREANENLLLAALRAQELLDSAHLANRRQVEFMGVIAHELRSPLAPITNAAALLGMAKAGGTVLPMVKGVIERQVAHLSRLVGDLLDLTRARSGKMRLEISRTDLVSVIEEAATDAQMAVDGRRQQFRVEVPGGVVSVNGDRLRLAQIVANLIGNSSKYTPDGGAIALSLRVDGPDAVISVADNGIGITSEALSEVFEPFVQERHATQFDGSGLGLGLALVRELVQGHGGRVTAASDGPGCGSRFTVTLPLLRVSG